MEREEREKLNILQAETAGIVILEPEQEKVIQQALESKQKEETDLTTKFADTGKAIAWLTAIDGLKKEIVTLADEAHKLQSDIDAFKPNRERLSRALSAAVLDAIYATLTAIRKQQVDDQAALKTEEGALPTLETSPKEQAEALKSTDLQTARVKEELKAAAPILKKVRSLDQKLADQKKTVTEGEEGCKKDTAKIDADKQAMLKEQEKRSRAHESLDLVDGCFKEHAQDEWLISGIAGVEEQLSDLLSRQKEILQKRNEHDKAATALRQATKSLDDSQSGWFQLSHTLQLNRSMDSA